MNKNQKELFCWNYFCTLCDMLKNTMQYLDHSDPYNLKCNSYEFQKIIMLSSMEFENIAKQLCLLTNPTLNLKKMNIISITKEILTNYPNMNKTTIMNDYNVYSPLKNWQIKKDSSGNEYVSGLDWWDSYNNIKHNSYDNYKESNLKNAINSLASLMILEINYIKITTGKNNIMNDKPCSYFINPFQDSILLV